jgi:UDP-N-acetylglucosamine/UDP-N-acetylgalactosamine diphosphorylase
MELPVTTSEELSSSKPPKDLQDRLEGLGQGHVTKHWESLDEEQRGLLCAQIASIDLVELEKYLKKGKTAKAETPRDSATPEGSLAKKERPKKPALGKRTSIKELFTKKTSRGKGELQPVSSKQVCSKSSVTALTRSSCVNKGLNLIAEGKVGVILLAGGQGTRLGTDIPKGCVDIKLTSKKTLFCIHAERILTLQRIAAERKFGIGGAIQNPIKWYIMLSDFTEEYTKQYFKANYWFGLEESQIFFYNQGKLPCLSEDDDKILLRSPWEITESPDGNGGIYRALQRSGCLRDMAEAGIESLDCYSIDNLLAKIADPFFIGYCHKYGADLGCRTLAKASPDERVGVFVRKGKGVGVVEYSELDPDSAKEVKKDGELLYNWSNICMQYYSRKFLEKICKEDLSLLEHHLARKSIQTVDGQVNGVKLEKFIFDVFPHAKKTCLVEVSRSEEFAPVKNAFGCDRDSPDTAKKLLMSLHRQWAEHAGANIVSAIGEEDGGIEISPRISYGGENLAARCHGQLIESGTIIQDIQKELFILPKPRFQNILNDDAQRSPLAVRKLPRSAELDTIGSPRSSLYEEGCKGKKEGNGKVSCSGNKKVLKNTILVSLGLLLATKVFRKT